MAAKRVKPVAKEIADEEEFAMNVMAVKHGLKIHKAPPPTVAAEITKKWPKLAGNKKAIQEVYDHLISSWAHFIDSRWLKFLEFLSFMHKARNDRKMGKKVDYEKAFKNFDHFFQRDFRGDMRLYYNRLKKKKDDWEKWEDFESYAAQVTGYRGFDFYTGGSLIKEQREELLKILNKYAHHAKLQAQESYYNQYNEYDQEFDFGDPSYELEQVKHSNYYGNYYGDQPHTGSQLRNGAMKYGTRTVDFRMVMLIAVIFCLCFVAAILTNMISWVGGYVFAKFVGNNMKNQNGQLANECENI
eukprot:59683_1